METQLLRTAPDGDQTVVRIEVFPERDGNLDFECDVVDVRFDLSE